MDRKGVRRFRFQISRVIMVENFLRQIWTEYKPDPTEHKTESEFDAVYMLNQKTHIAQFFFSVKFVDV